MCESNHSAGFVVDRVSQRRALLAGASLLLGFCYGLVALVPADWWFIDPLLTMLVYLILITILHRGRGIPDFPVYILTSLLTWQLFTKIVTGSMSTNT